MTPILWRSSQWDVLSSKLFYKIAEFLMNVKRFANFGIERGLSRLSRLQRICSKENPLSSLDLLATVLILSLLKLYLCTYVPIYRFTCLPIYPNHPILDPLCMFVVSEEFILNEES